MTLELRPLTADDFDQWTPLWQAYLTFYESNLSDDVSKTSFTRLVDHENTERGAILALIDGQAVGFTHYIFHAHNWHINDVCYLQDLYVAPEARGNGAARALIEAVYDVADAADCAAVYWLTQEFNHTARRLYDSIGTLTPFIKYQRP